MHFLDRRTKLGEAAHKSGINIGLEVQMITTDGEAHHRKIESTCSIQGQGSNRGCISQLLMQENAMTSVDEKTREHEVGSDAWHSFLDDFTRQHSGCTVNIEMFTSAGRQIQTKTGRLLSVGIDKPPRSARAYVELEELFHGIVTEIIPSPSRITTRLLGFREELAITSEDGRRTVLLVQQWR